MQTSLMVRIEMCIMLPSENRTIHDIVEMFSRGVMEGFLVISEAARTVN